MMSRTSSDHAMTTHNHRLPLKPRPVNVENGMASSSLPSRLSSSSLCSKGSSLRGSATSVTTSSHQSKQFLSQLESSQNENNDRVSSLNSAALRRATAATSSSSSSSGDNNSSTLAETGQRIPLASGKAPSAHHQSQRPPSSEAAPRSESRRRAPSSSSGSSSRKKVAEKESDEPVTIEEVRKAPNGGYTIHRYLRGRLLGKGGFAKVYHCTSLDTNKAYAVKIVPKANLVKKRAREKLQAEIKIHRTLKHEHVCEFKHFFEDRNNCYILLELCANQSMNELIKRRKRLTEEEVRYFMQQLIDATEYMHEVNVIHRDLKLGNLFLDKYLRLKVGDLGLATRVESSEEKRKTICGTPNYIAPEVIDGNKETRGHSFEVDIWSIGVILFTTLVGKPPYEAKDVKATYKRILANEYSFPSHVQISDDARDLIGSMLQTRPDLRPRLDEIRAHPFFTYGQIPTGLPSNATHVAPVWEVDEFGNLSARPSEPPVRKKNPHGDSLKHGGRSSSLRKPLATKDPNSRTSGHDHERGGVKHTSYRPSSSSQRASQRQAPRRDNVSGGGARFDIYDESEGHDNNGARQYRASNTSRPRHSKPPQSRPVHSRVLPDDEVNGLVERAGALALDEMKKTPSPAAEVVMPPPDTAEPETRATPPLSSLPQEQQADCNQPGTADKDLQVLESMHQRLIQRLSSQDEHDYGDRSGGSDWSATGATKWVTRYVDYTSKYGLGFLLNDGSAGVYFNDSTKAVLSPSNDTFVYVERKKGSSQGCDPVCETHTLSSYPESLQKKVTLLKHFQKYLLEQQKRAEEVEGAEPLAITDDLEEGQVTDPSSLVYLKKWVRTKHAILFRMSNSTVQVVFYDTTEILLSSEARLVCFVDKERQRRTHHIDEIALEKHSDVAKRLKYAKDILQQLISGAKR